MKELIDEIEQATEHELVRANKIHPVFQSMHEAYGVIKEEYEEAQADLRIIDFSFGKFWACVKDDKQRDAQAHLKELKDVAMHCAAEMVQVAAMAQKAMDSLKTRG